VDGKIQDNWVMVDFPDVMRQLGVDPFQGMGWDDYGTEYDSSKKDSETTVLGGGHK